ncbi:DNA recombination protein RmuC [Diaminobutyricimonas aerilata]|uniref:DNA recombination protein RmuC n=1 Tax=Diaminobutyricimonas aerilata TaxID=1162967 RepID=A0A2M9CHX5_9MICO|nr:DNA recombination protein RmuC [Diaminobutyricimonas aerilata]PJJ71526.1 DNA recombination protein RmuC [Diaminobutyricimonas aerilata]
MDAVLPLLLGLLIGVALGAVIGLLVARSRRVEPVTDLADHRLVEEQHARELVELRAAEAEVRAELQAAESMRRAELERELASITATAESLREQVATQQQRNAELVERHRLEAEARVEAERRESKVLQALTPVQETLRTMQQKVTELETQRNLQHGELAQQLRSATESEERLRATAESLAAALKNNSTRGVWGETQLRSVVEAAGLLQRVNFDVQSSIVSDRGHGRPDMVVNLPGGKSIAVDAKVPFNSYIEANSIAATAPDAELARRETLMRAHVKAVRDHITTLGSKAYWEGLDASPEMVIAFIPSESLLSSALEVDPTIMEFAFSKRVALASPVTLFSVLKTVAVSWQQATVTEEAKTLFDLSRELYGRLATMAQHVEKLGRSVKATVNDYNKFVGSLERQVLPSARKLNVLDESKVIGAMEGVEETPRELTAYELTGTTERAPKRAVAAAVELEFAALEETGIGRPEIDPAQVTPVLGDEETRRTA